MSTIRYEVIALLGVYIEGLGEREFGGEFLITEEKAERLHLDESPGLKRTDSKPARKSKSSPADSAPDLAQEG